MVYNLYEKRRIIHFYRLGCRPPTIVKLLLEENLKVSREGVAKFIARFIETCSLSRKPGSGRPLSITQQMQAIVEAKMREDDETTAYQLRSLLLSQGFNISKRTVLRCRTQLGWTFRGSAYCKLIRHANKVKRLEWARQYLHNSFDDVVWTDKCSVQLESHKQFCCRKQGEPPRLKPRYNLVLHSTHRIYICINTLFKKMCYCKLMLFLYRAKHSVKVHVWAGISKRGRTGICIFEGIMDAILYTEVFYCLFSELFIQIVAVLWLTITRSIPPTKRRTSFLRIK